VRSSFLRVYAKADIADLPRKVMHRAVKNARPLIEAKCRERGMSEEAIGKLFADYPSD
jgi:hypothetical protein